MTAARRVTVEPGDPLGTDATRRPSLAAAEQRARAFGFLALRIETGTRQPEAIALYDGYTDRRIENYGPHAGDPTRVCFEKVLRR